MPDFFELQYQNFSYFGTNSLIKGEFHLSGTVKIASKLEGHIFMQKEGKITIERSGSFTGDIKCFDIEIFGELEGNIESQGKIILQPSSKITGTIQAENITIYPGATVNIEGHTT